MEPGFRVSAGPLSQISVPLMSAETALYLAAGADGWWKARERSSALLDIIRARGAKLVCPSIFDCSNYEQQRRDEVITGIARQVGGTFISFDLPKASTARNAGSSLLCLRALITGLLCFFELEATVRILAPVLPGYFITEDQGGRRVEFEGPVLAALKEYIAAVDTEERTSSLRKALLQHVDHQLSRFGRAAADDLSRSDDTASLETGLFVGLLRWLLTPANARETLCYPTRSLKVWALGQIFSNLGFRIEIDLKPVSTAQEYRIQVEQYSPHMHRSPTIFLVTRSVGPTDRDASAFRNICPLRPRLVSIGSIPFLEFRDWATKSGQITVEKLSEIWAYSFSRAATTFGEAIRVEKQVYVLELRIVKPDVDSPLDPLLKSTLCAWLDCADLPDLTWLFYEPLLRYVKLTGNAPTASRETPSGRVVVYDSLFNDLVSWRCQSNIMHVIMTICTASVLGACSNFIRVNGKPLDLSSEIAIQPGFIYSGIPLRWMAWIGEFCKANGSFHDNPFQLSMPPPSCPRGSIGCSLGFRLFQIVTGSSEPSYPQHKGVTLGVTGNGLCFMPDFVVTPSLTSQFLTYHLQYGLVVDLPVGDDGFITLAEEPAAPNTAPQHEPVTIRPRSKTMSMVPDHSSTSLELEPFWEGDHTKLVFQIRNDGVLYGTLPPTTFARCHKAHWVCCSCGAFARRTELGNRTTMERPQDERWAESLAFSEALRLKLSPDPDEQCHRTLVINTVGGRNSDLNNVAGLVALSKATEDDVCVLTDCLDCAYKFAMAACSNAVSSLGFLAFNHYRKATIIGVDTRLYRALKAEGKLWFGYPSFAGGPR
jgi:hypothetical protein